MTATCFTMPTRVYIEDTDAGGVVYHANYLKFMERARTEFFRTLGYHKPAFITPDLFMVVASADIAYKKPARLDDEISVTAEITLLAKSYIIFEQNIQRGDTLLTTGALKLACVKTDTQRPTALPAELYKTILPLVRRN